MNQWFDEIEVFKSSSTLKERVEALGEQIERDYLGKELVLIGILKGSFIFLADLCRIIDLPLSIDFIGLASYEGTQSTGIVRITSDLTQPIEGKHVLIVEDIIDTGQTMDFLLKNLRTRRPASLKVCSLLFKPSRNIVPITIDYLGFEIPDVFVVGYGLDFEGKYRNLSFLGVLKNG